MSVYTITVAFLVEDQINVQVEGDPYPLGIYNETGYDLDVLLTEARQAIEKAHA